MFFFISGILSTVFAENPYRAFWGDIERSEGFFTILHFFVFLILILFFFEKKDWVTYLKALVMGGFIISLGSVLQFFRIRILPWIPGNDFRPGSLFENPAFMADYLLFVLAFSLIFLIKFYKNNSCFFYFS